MNIKKWINLNKNKIDINELYYLINSVIGQECYFKDFELPRIVKKCLDIALKKRIQGFSLAKIVGKKAFYNDEFLTNEETLDPRPETEFLISQINGRPKKILELGVGTGCLILSILKKFDKSKGLGVDISKGALDVAKENANILNLERRIEFVQNNWANDITGHFDLIVSNPPYILYEEKSKLSKEVLNDPEIALFGDLSTYIELMSSLRDLTFNQLLLEIPKNILYNFIEKYKNIYYIDIIQIYNTDIYCLNIRNLY